jgi:hypothetical protein
MISCTSCTTQREEQGSYDPNQLTSLNLTWLDLNSLSLKVIILFKMNDNSYENAAHRLSSFVEQPNTTGIGRLDESYILNPEIVIARKDFAIHDFTNEISTNTDRASSCLMADGSLTSLINAVNNTLEHSSRYEVQVQFRNLTFWNKMPEKQILTVGLAFEHDCGQRRKAPSEHYQRSNGSHSTQENDARHGASWMWYCRSYQDNSTFV